MTETQLRVCVILDAIALALFALGTAIGSNAFPGLEIAIIIGMGFQIWGAASRPRALAPE